jgi:hypothetical protein
MKIFLYIYFISFLFSSCNKLEKGIIIKKRYEKPERNLTLIPTKIGSVTIMQSYWIHDNEDFIITIEGNKDGKIIHQDVYITKQCYEELNAGDTWIKSKDCEYNDENNDKIKAN